MDEGQAYCAAQTRTANAEQVDGRLRLAVPLEALVNDSLVLGGIGLFCFSRARSEIAVIDDQRKAKGELLLVVLTAVAYYSLPQGNSDHPLVFQVTRVSSALLKVLRGVQWPAPPVTDGNITTFLEADATHMDLPSGAMWSVLEHALTKWTYSNVSDSEGCVDLSGPHHRESFPASRANASAQGSDTPAAAQTSSVCFGLTSFGRWESIQSGLAKQQVFLRFASKQDRCAKAGHSCVQEHAT